MSHFDAENINTSLSSEGRDVRESVYCTVQAIVVAVVAPTINVKVNKDNDRVIIILSCRVSAAEEKNWRLPYFLFMSSTFVGLLLSFMVVHDDVDHKIIISLLEGIND